MDSKTDGVTVKNAWEPKIALGEELGETSGGRVFGMLAGDTITEADGELDGEGTGTIFEEEDTNGLGVLVGSVGEEADGEGQLDPASSTNSISVPASFARSALMEQDTQIFRETSARLPHLSNGGQSEDDVHGVNSNTVSGVHRQTLSSSLQGEIEIAGSEPPSTLQFSDDEQSLSSRHMSNDRP